MKPIVFAGLKGPCRFSSFFFPIWILSKFECFAVSICILVLYITYGAYDISIDFTMKSMVKNCDENGPWEITSISVIS